MATLHSAYSVDPSDVQGERVAVLGFGSQGHAHALNLKDSGFDVRVGLRRGSGSWDKAEAAGLPPVPVSEAVADATIVALLVPDTAQPELYHSEVAPHVRAGAMVLFAHGFAVRFGRLQAAGDLDVCMVAPKAPGHLVRRTFLAGQGAPALLAVDQDATGQAKARALAYAWGIGCARAGVIETTFAEETETDLFGEQAVLCGGLSAMVHAGFETLVDAGYQPEVAYFECLHELKLIVDLLYEGGFGRMRGSISDTAEYGDYTRGKRVVDDGTRRRLREILAEVRDGTFATEWIKEAEMGFSAFSHMREEAGRHPLEEVGSRLRSMMPWLRSDSIAEPRAALAVSAPSRGESS